MKRTFRLAGGMLLVLALLTMLGIVSVSAQGPTGTATPEATNTPVGPVQAPPAAAAAPGTDNPLAATTFGSSAAAIPAGGNQWFKFNYGTSDSALPRPLVTIRMLNGVQNGTGFEVWSPERMQGNWWENQPVGRGTREALPNCVQTLTDQTTQRCQTNDLVWVGGFGAPGTYFVRVTNPTNNAVTPQFIISGPGIAECQTGTLAQTQAQNANQGATVMCQNPTADQLLSMSTNKNQGASNVPAAAPTVSATETTAPSATTSTPEATATTSAPAATSTTAAPSLATSTPASAPALASETPTTTTMTTPAAGANNVTGLPICTPTPTPSGTLTPTPTLAAGSTAVPSPTPNCVMPGSSSGSSSSSSSASPSATP